MKYIYCVERTTIAGYDEYDSFVCIHESWQEALKLTSNFDGMNEDECEVSMIGIANDDLEIGHIVCSSFNAG